MTKNETEMCLNTISPQLGVESNCFDDASFSQASEISIFGEYGTMAVVYGSSGAYYRLELKILELLFALKYLAGRLFASLSFLESYNSGCSWNQLIDKEVLFVSYIESNDFMLLILNEPTDNLKMFAPGNEIKPFLADGLPDTIPNKMWFWDNNLEYIGDENTIERASPILTCSRLVPMSK